MSNRTSYAAICEAHPEITVFAQAWWLNIVCVDWAAAIVTKGNHLKGVWAYPTENKMGVSMIRSPKLTPYLGPTVFVPTDVKESNIDSYEHETIAELMQQLPNAKVWNLAIQPGIQQAGLFKKYKLTSQVQQTFLLDLSNDEPALLANMKESLRKNIRQGEKEITITNSPEYIEDMYRFHLATLAKKGKNLAYTSTDFKRLMEACVAHNAGALWVAKDDTTIHAMVWQVWDANRSYCFMAAQNPKSTNYKAMSAALWQAIRHSKQQGHKIFDLEGSMDEGVERFYRSFGGKRSLYMILIKNTSRLWKAKQAILG